MKNKQQKLKKVFWTTWYYFNRAINHPQEYFIAFKDC
jgi:hypothetical protein